MATALEINDVSKRYGPRWAVARLSYALPEGRSLLLTGHNGSGKTTLMRIIATALQPTAGSIRVLGMDTREQTETIRQQVALLSHASFLYEDLTAEQNLTFLARVIGMPDVKSEVAALLDRVGLKKRSDSPVRQFSAGMRGATAQRLGKFEQCDGGTIFLDEIGDMTPTTQTKILRVLQEGDIQRVGGVDTIKVNVRVVAATNKDLEALVREKKFREDLYYRLNVVRVKLPPLRERTEDVPQIVDFFVQNLAKAKKVKSRKVAPEAMALLSAYPWPGNVRELENVVYRSAVAATGDTILPKDLPDEVREPKAADSSIGNGDSLESLYDKLAKALRAQHPGEEMATLTEAMQSRLPEGEAKKKRAKK